MQHSERGTLRCPWSVDKFFNFTYFSYICIEGNWDTRSIQQQKKWKYGRIRVRKCRETCRMDKQKPKTLLKMTTTWMHKETCRMICQIVYRSSSMDWLMKVSQNTETLPVLLMNYLQSREQQWYRESTAFLLTSRMMGIAMCVWGRNNEGPCPERDIFGDLVTADHKVLSDGTQKPNKKETTIERWNPSDFEIPEWLQEFRMMKFLNTETLTPVLLMKCLQSRLQRDVRIWGKHSVYTHFHKDRNCEICQRTKIARAPCRRRNGGAVHRADNFGDLITADHKVLSEGCESRNNHRYAIVVQDLATQWIQSYPCKTKTSQETQRSLQKFLEPERKPKVMFTDNSSNSEKLVKISHGIIARLHHTDRRLMGLLKGQGAEQKKVLLLYCCNRV